MSIRRQALGVMLVLALASGCAGQGGGNAGASTQPTASQPRVAATDTSGAATAKAGSAGATGGPVIAGADLCGLLGPGDFAAVGVQGTGRPSENNPDPNNAYCVYAGKSAGTGGVEFDAFLAASKADSQASYEAASAPMLDFANDGKTAFPDADGAAIRQDIPGPYAEIAIWKGRLVFDIGIPPSNASKDQLISLAKVVLLRAANLI